MSLVTCCEITISGIQGEESCGLARRRLAGPSTIDEEPGDDQMTRHDVGNFPLTIRGVCCGGIIWNGPSVWAREPQHPDAHTRVWFV